LIIPQADGRLAHHDRAAELLDGRRRAGLAG
jgi:hypothetical protein